MKIALVSLARRGGMVHFQAELANALARTATIIAVCSSRAPASLFSPEVRRLAVPTGRGTFSSVLRALNPFTWIRLFRLFKSSRPDVVHVVGAHEWNPLIAVLATWLHTPLVFTMHDPIAHPGTNFVMRASNTITARMSDAIVVMTRWGRDQLIGRGVADTKVYHIPHGAYSFFTQWGSRVRAGKTILFFVRIERYKGLGILLDAFARIRADLPGWKLILAGGGRTSTTPKEELADVEVLDRYIPDHEVARLMQRASMIVAPYTTATQSGAIATAVAFGRPVIVSDVGGLKEMVVPGRTGLVVPANDVPALARAMRKLATDPARAALMGRNALALARGAWSWTQVARQHLSIYRTVLAQSEAL